MANPIHRINIVAKDKRSQRKVADSTTKLDKTCHVMACDLSHAMAGAPLRHHACRASSKAARAAPRA